MKRLICIVNFRNSFQGASNSVNFDWSESITAAIKDDPTYFPETDEENELDLNSNVKEGEEEVSEAELVVNRKKDILQKRNIAHEAQREQAEKMLKESNQRFI